MMKADTIHSLPTQVTLQGQALTIADVLAVARHYAPVELGWEAIVRIKAARQIVERIADEGKAVYGVTTGIGYLSRVHIRHEQMIDLQRNLLYSHAAGVGEPLSEEIARAMMLLLAASLARGNSGVRTDVVELLLNMLNARFYPIIPSRGSVGSSGDLAPLSHLALTLIGDGEVIYQGEHMNGGNALQKAGLTSLCLQAKEGIALINGTHMMEAIATLAIADAQSLLRSAEVACAMSIEALMGNHTPLDARIHTRRGQLGQQASAARLRELVKDSEIQVSQQGNGRVQDPYTLRCAPQVLGAVRDAIEYCSEIFERELGAVTDNPLIFPEDGDVLSGGNFHGQPLALALDMLAIALTYLASFSERRIYNLIGPHDWDTQGPPLFLTPNPGLNSGLMIMQYVAAALTNEIKILAHPASIDSIPTSASQEDFNSMGATSAHKLLQILESTRQIVGMEFLCAAQMLEFRKPLKPGKGVQQAYEIVRSHVPMLENDRLMAPDISIMAQVVKDSDFDTCA
jgi:histidine ammonia-lyase